MIDKNLRQHFRIAKNSPVPLYYQLKSAILELFENGYYKPGDKLPTVYHQTKSKRHVCLGTESRRQFLYEIKQL